MSPKYLESTTNPKMEEEKKVTEKKGSQTVRVNERGVIFLLLCLKPFNCNREGYQKRKM